jgi:hypothetical protein
MFAVMAMVLMDSCGMGRSPDRSTSISVAQDSKPVVRQTRLTGSIIMEDECHTWWHLTKNSSHAQCVNCAGCAGTTYATSVVDWPPARPVRSGMGQVAADGCLAVQMDRRIGCTHIA